MESSQRSFAIPYQTFIARIQFLTNNMYAVKILQDT